MRKQHDCSRSSRMPAKAAIATMGILASGAGLVLAFQEPAVPKRPSLFPKQEVHAASTPPAAVVAKPPLAKERPEDVSAIQALNAAFTKAFNAGDSVALSQLFTEDAVAVDENNLTAEGRAAISARFARSFAEHPGKSIEITTETIRFLGPDTAIEDGIARIAWPVSTEEGEKPAADYETTRYTVVYVKRNGTWQHASIHDYPSEVESAAPSSVESNYEQLRPLEWLVGDWVEEGSDVFLSSNFAWSDNRNYLIRTFQLRIPGQKSVTGTQRIGWDPSVKQIRSWAFDSDGGFSEGVWSRKGENTWVIKATGVTPDGQIATDTRTITRSGTDHLTWRSVDRTLGGEVQDDTPEYTMARRPPAPGEAKRKRGTP